MTELQETDQHEVLGEQLPRVLTQWDDESLKALGEKLGPSGKSIVWDITHEEFLYARWGLVGGLLCVLIGAALSLAGAGAATTAG